MSEEDLSQSKIEEQGATGAAAPSRGLLEYQPIEDCVGHLFDLSDPEHQRILEELKEQDRANFKHAYEAVNKSPTLRVHLTAEDHRFYHEFSKEGATGATGASEEGATGCVAL